MRTFTFLASAALFLFCMALSQTDTTNASNNPPAEYPGMSVEEDHYLLKSADDSHDNTGERGIVWYQMESIPYDIAPADVNGDGLIDLVTGDYLRDISVIINQGNGSFAPPVEYSVWGAQYKVHTVDLDGDYDEDIVTMGFSSGEYGRLCVLFNQGDGVFDPPVYYFLNSPLTGLSLTTADLDNDHDPDVAISYSSDHVSWFENDGTGQLGDSHQISGGSFRWGDDIVAGDFDDDGEMDLATSVKRDWYEYSDTAIQIFFNEGSGQSWTRKEFEFVGVLGGYDVMYDLDAGDIDGDGDLDITALKYDAFIKDQYIYLLNLGNRDFESGEVSGFYHEGTIQLADMMGDGDLDIVTPFRPGLDELSLRVLLNQDHGSSFFNFERFIGNELNSAAAFSVCDINADGVLDVVFTRGTNHGGMWLITNPYNPSRPVLEQGDLRRGERVTFQVTGATPGAPVYFFFCLSTPGNSRGIEMFGGITLDLPEPYVQIGTAVADEEGTASITPAVPGLAPLATVTTQAVVYEGEGGAESRKTNFITAPVLE